VPKSKGANAGSFGSRAQQRTTKKVLPMLIARGLELELVLDRFASAFACSTTPTLPNRWRREAGLRGWALGKYPELKADLPK
jgi:hypothetical protein